MRPPAVADTQPAATAPESGVPEEKLGVLFVHGMGEQARGDTLLGFGEPVVTFLRRWIDQQQGTDPFESQVRLLDVEAIRVLGSDPNVPAHTTIKIRGHDNRSWLMAESWWASDFKPATFNEVLNWGIRVVPFVLSDTLRYQWSRRRDFLENGQILFTVLTGPLLQALLLLMLPIAVIPFLRGIVGNVMVRLANSIGDPYLLLSSPIRLASMVERIHHDIRWLQRQQCTGISIVAHSQGAAVAHHALRSFPPDHQRVPFRRFITLGAAIEKLNFLQKIDMRGKSLLRGGILQSVWALLLVLSLSLAWRISWLGIDGHWWTLGLWILFTSLFWLSPLISRLLLGAEPIDYVEPKRDDLWSRRNSDSSTATWDDIYARSDPVSLGPIKRLGNASVEIRNQDSIVFDHTSYFENTEQFMVRLVGGLSIDSGWTDLFDPDDPAFAEAARQRSRRVDWLNHAFVTVASTVVVAAIALLLLSRLDETGRPVKAVVEFLGDQLTVPFEGVVRGHTGDGEIAEAVLGIGSLIVSAAVIFTVLIKGMWHRWNASKADRLLRHEPLGPFFEDGQWFLLMTAAVPVAAVLYLAFAAW